MKDNEAPVLIITGTVVIRAHSSHLRAEIDRPVGSYVPKEFINKTFPDVDDLHALPLRGLMNLALEFYGEIKAAQQTDQLLGIHQLPNCERATEP